MSWYRRDGTDLAASAKSARATERHAGGHVPRAGRPLGPRRRRGRLQPDADAAGPPDPNGEREPNDDSLDAQTLALGVRRSGRLARNNDLDISRFSLQAAERLQLTSRRPADGAVAWGIYRTASPTWRASGPRRSACRSARTVACPPATTSCGSRRHAQQGPLPVELDREDPFDARPPLAATVAVTTARTASAAYWQAGQHVGGQVSHHQHRRGAESLQLDAVTQRLCVGRDSSARARSTLAAGATASGAADDRRPARCLGRRPVRSRSAHATPRGPVHGPRRAHARRRGARR